MLMLRALLLFGLALFAPLSKAGGAHGAPWLDHHDYWHTWLDFAPDRVDPVAAKASLDEHLSSRGQDRLEDEVRETARHLGVNVTAPGFDWREHIYLRWEPHISSYFTMPPPPVPADWMNPGFDPAAAGWVRRSGPAQMGRLQATADNRPILPVPGFMMVRTAYHRANLALDEVRPLSLSLEYRGGVRVFVNGTEVARGHLPPGALPPHTPAVGYDSVPVASEFGQWVWNSASLLRAQEAGKLLDRRIDPIEIPASLLRRGNNVIAIENRAPLVHPSALAHNRAYGILGTRTRDFVIALPQTGILSFTLRPAASATTPAAAPPLRRPPGLQVWAGDIHQRYFGNDHLEPGAGPGTLRVAACRNGRFAAMLLVGADRDLSDLLIETSPFRTARGELLPADAVKVGAMTPHAFDEDYLKRLGNHRGKLTTSVIPLIDRRYRRFENGAGKLFDQITETVPATLAGGETRPFWITVDIPADATPGDYRGGVRVSARGQTPVVVMVEVSVADWTLPSPREFSQFVWIEQSPYGLAEQFKVEPWSEAHWQLIETSFRHLARIGASFVHVPVLQRTEFGNVGDAMIRWSGDPTTENVRLDFSIMDRYLDLAARTLGPPRVVSVNIMQGGNEKNMDLSSTVLFTDRREPVNIAKHPHLYGVLAREVLARFRARGWESALHWGFFWDGASQPELFDLMAKHAPDVYWARAGHPRGRSSDRVRVQSEVFQTGTAGRPGMTVVVTPRMYSPTHTLEGYFPPFSFRLLPVRASHSGEAGFLGGRDGKPARQTAYDGFGRLGADYGDAWGRDINIRYDVVDFPVKNLLWPGNNKVDTSQRFEILREGVQEAEARIFLQRALDAGRLPAPLAARVRDTLARGIGETSYVPAYAASFVDSHLLNDHPQDWQARSRRLFELAAEVAAATRSHR